MVSFLQVCFHHQAELIMGEVAPNRKPPLQNAIVMCCAALFCNCFFSISSHCGLAKNGNWMSLRGTISRLPDWETDLQEKRGVVDRNELGNRLLSDWREHSAIAGSPDSLLRTGQARATVVINGKIGPNAQGIAAS
jgi:hypothetical protein